MRNVNWRGDGVGQKTDRTPRRTDALLARARLQRWLDGQISPFAKRAARPKVKARAAH